MPEIARTARDMIAGMTPSRLPGAFVFVSLGPHDADPALITRAIGMFREAEGLSLILPLDAAREHGCPVQSPMACLTLNVYSSLEGVGLTAAVAQALAANGIACNMVAAYHHDHAFVPVDDAERAIEILQRLQAEAAAS